MGLVNNPARVLRDFLAAQGVGVSPTATPTVSTWQLTSDKMPPDGDRFVTVYNDGEINQGRIQKTGERIVKPRVLIRVRCVDEAEGRAKGREVEAILDRVGVPEPVGLGRSVSVTSGAAEYTLTNAMVVTSLSPAQPEPERRRVVFSMTAQLTLKKED